MCSSSANVNATELQGSNLVPLLFLIYINDVSDTVLCGPKLSADDIWLVSTIKKLKATPTNLNNY